MDENEEEEEEAAGINLRATVRLVICTVEANVVGGDSSLVACMWRVAP